MACLASLLLHSQRRRAPRFCARPQVARPSPERAQQRGPVGPKEPSQLLEEHEQTCGGRSRQELKFYAANGFWPEQRGRLHYSTESGKLCVEWRNEPEEERATLGTASPEQGT